MKENGKMINKMEMAKKYGLMEQYIKESMLMEKRMEKGNFIGLMVQFIKEILPIII